VTGASGPAGRTVHAGLIARRQHGAWRGVLIEGPSGSGKSDLALRALSEGFRLVADDRVVLWVSAGRLFGRAPAPLRDLLEVRSLDVVPAPALALAEIALAVRAGPGERIPGSQRVEMLGVAVHQMELDLRQASAPAKLRRALALFDRADNRRI
jgi:serine kinase of HPr protein (carbohydrate metabolism regulator)